jgi:TrmH family RNA methyltransferase
MSRSFGAAGSARVVPVTRENQWFQLALALKTNRQKRRRERLFFVEGVRSIDQLRGNPAWPVRALLYCPARRLSGWARDVLAENPAAERLELSARLMDRLSDREEGSEMLALVRMPAIALEDLPAGAESCVVVLDRPGNPGNLGSIIRSCDAFGVAGIAITGHAVDPYDPVVVRASAGAFFTQRIAQAETGTQLDEWLAGIVRRQPGTRIVGTSARADRTVDSTTLAGPVVLLFGSETMGLSAHLKSLCHELVGMPMRGVVSSLNLAAAVTVVLYERDRQRRQHG